MIDWFRVEVTDEQGQVVAIEQESLAGRDIGEREERVLVAAIDHLCGFSSYAGLRAQLADAMTNATRMRVQRDDWRTRAERATKRAQRLRHQCRDLEAENQRLVQEGARLVQESERARSLESRAAVANALLSAKWKTLGELLCIARRYASECGECAGTRVRPDETPCQECTDIWAVIDKAEGRR